MKIILNSLLLLMFVVFLSSCEENSVEPSILNDIQSYVDNLELEKVQKVEILIEVKEEDLFVFSVLYGEPQDCMSGCFYARFLGLKYKNKINNFEQYDIESNETYLFSQDFFELLKEKNKPLFYGTHLPLLASDEDTPTDVLISITVILYNYISTHIAYKLLENPVVKKNTEILTLLANLPVFQGDSYEEVRKIAQELLNG